MRALRTWLFAIGFLLGCSADKLPGSSTGGTGGGTTATTGGTGGSTSSGGGMTTSGGTGGAGGTASGGTGGMTSTGGTGGMTSSGGTGGMTGSGGTGGMTGSGGAGGGAATGTLLVLAGGIPDSLAQGVRWTSSSGWVPSSINLQFRKAAMAPVDGGALMVGRRFAFNPPMGDNDLFRATWTGAAGWSPVEPLNAVAIGGPALAPHGVATLLATLDVTNKHVFAQYEGGAFGPFSAVPAGMPGTQAFGPSGPSLAPFGVAGIYLSYAGDDEQLYMTAKGEPGSPWDGSHSVPTSPVVNTQTPASFVDADGDLRLFYVRKSDGRVCTVTYVTPQNFWTGEEVVHQDAITGLSPSAAALPGGDAVVVWHGFNNQGIYFSRRQAGVWSAPGTVEIAAIVSSAPVVLTGLGGADAEILYTADGKLRWARLSGTTTTFGADPSVYNVNTLAAITLP